MLRRQWVLCWATEKAMMTDSIERSCIGCVTSLTGSSAVVAIDTNHNLAGCDASRLSIGRLISVTVGSSRVIGVIKSMSEPHVTFDDAHGHSRQRVAQIDFVGELRPTETNGFRFQRGVTNYPTIGDDAWTIITEDLRTIHRITDSETIEIGRLQQDSSVPAYINLDDLLTKHFAILGTTGVGKSCAVALVLKRILEKGDGLRIFLIDPHNEYGDCFGNMTKLINPKNIKLPFWLFSFEEIVDVFFRGRPGIDAELEILSEAIPIAKGKFAESSSFGTGNRLRKASSEGVGYTIDTPVPWRISDAIAVIDERMGKLENRSAWAKYHHLKTRMETVTKDPRYAFMFDNITIDDTMADVLGQLFRIPINGKPITVMQMAGFPAEVVDSVVSVLCRMAFEFALWSEGAAPLLVVCEEAHRYVPADRSLGFGPTRKSISRIAKEGRKYGVFLSVVSQRPAELDATILSQCSTIFAMRMANESDQMIVGSAVSDAAASLLDFLPSLGTREVVTFGEGVALPTRLSFTELPKDQLPVNNSAFASALSTAGLIDADFMDNVVDKWRNAASKARRGDSLLPDLDMGPDEDSETVQESMEGALPVLRPPIKDSGDDPIYSNGGFGQRSQPTQPQASANQEPIPADKPAPGGLDVDWQRLRDSALGNTR